MCYNANSRRTMGEHNILCHTQLYVRCPEARRTNGVTGSWKAKSRLDRVCYGCAGGNQIPKIHAVVESHCSKTAKRGAPDTRSKFVGTLVTFGSPFWSGYFRGIACDGGSENTGREEVASGGRCQWVLDAAFQAVEWPSQPLRFESVVLRTGFSTQSWCARMTMLER